MALAVARYQMKFGRQINLTIGRVLIAGADLKSPHCLSYLSFSWLSTLTSRKWVGLHFPLCLFLPFSNRLRGSQQGDSSPSSLKSKNGDYIRLMAKCFYHLVYAVHGMIFNYCIFCYKVTLIKLPQGYQA